MLGPVELNMREARVLGSLMEKELTTPQQYPLTLNSLLAACNQASNRDPVVQYEEQSIVSTLDELKQRRLVRFVLPSHGRSVVRYRHILDETLALDVRQRALLAVLLLRGPQTIGELRGRTERMARFDGSDELEHELAYLAAREEPLVSCLGRRPGQKEDRWACLLAPLLGIDRFDREPDGWTESEGIDGSSVQSQSHHREDLRLELAELRNEVRDLRRELDELRSSLGG